MKRSHRRYVIVLAGVISAGGLVLTGLWLRPRLAVGRIRTEGITSYYVYSGTDAGHTGKLPAIIFIGHPLSSPFEDLDTYKDRFDEPVLLIWSGLVADLRKDCRTADETVWARKRPLFLTLLDDYERKLPIDKDRIYLTGYSAAGVYAWMLAYDHPELYGAVVPMSAPSYPRQIQEHLEAAHTLVTVVVRGEKDDTPPCDLAGEMRTGRIIESCNYDSRFVLKAGEGHRDMHKYWRENLQYVLQFRRKDNQKMTSSRQHTAASCRLWREPRNELQAHLEELLEAGHSRNLSESEVMNMVEKAGSVSQTDSQRHGVMVRRNAEPQAFVRRSQIVGKAIFLYSYGP
jgi:pimeloyl-ACP methyl ester carboxylesterase